MLKNAVSLNRQVPLLKSLTAKVRVFRPKSSENQEIRDELESILASESFRGSKRCQSFLRFVVEAVLSGDGDQLKERTLGIELFQRSPTYDTGEDAIVRVKANDVRRRLAQYSVTAAPERSVRIELPPGSYMPRFHRSVPGSPVASASAPPRKRKWIALLAGVFLLLAAGTYVGIYSSNPVRQFWEPVLTSQTAPIVCLGEPDVFVRDSPEPPVTSRLSSAGGSFTPGVPINGNANETGSPSSVIRVPDSFVGFGDSSASFLIGQILQSLGRSSRVRLSNLVSFSDLKVSPAVLIGAFSNRWTMSLTNNLRFSFVDRDGKHIIADRDHPSRVWEVPSLGRTGKASEDYAIVSRILNSPSGQTVISVAGISGYGCQAGGEFVTDARALRTLIQRAPRNWKHMNMQVVLRTKVVNDTPSPGEIVAVYFW